MAGNLNSRPNYLITTVCLYFDIGNVKILALEIRKLLQIEQKKSKILKLIKSKKTTKI